MPRWLTIYVYIYYTTLYTALQSPKHEYVSDFGQTCWIQRGPFITRYPKWRPYGTVAQVQYARVAIVKIRKKNDYIGLHSAMYDPKMKRLTRRNKKE